MLAGALAAALGIFPVSWLSGLHAAGWRRAAGWWLMAFGFGVSFVADLTSLAVGHPLVSQVYLVTQGAAFAYALAPPRVAERCVAVLLVAAGASIALRQGAGLDWLLHLVAWGGTAALAWHTVPRGTLRTALLVYFAGGAAAWLAFVADPGCGAWLAYQGTRAAGIAVWGWAAWWASGALPRGWPHAD